MCTPQLDHSEMFTELYREEKKEAGDRGGQKNKRGKCSDKDPAQTIINLKIKLFFKKQGDDWEAIPQIVTLFLYFPDNETVGDLFHHCNS